MARASGSPESALGHRIGEVAIQPSSVQIQRVGEDEFSFWDAAKRFFAEKEAGNAGGPVAQNMKQLMGEHVGYMPPSGSAPTLPAAGPAPSPAPVPAGGPPAAPAPVDPLAKTAVDPLAKTMVDPLAKTAVDPLAETAPMAGEGASFASKLAKYGGGALGVVGGGYEAYEGAKEASEAKGPLDIVMAGLKLGAGGATTAGGIGTLAGAGGLAELGPAGWVLGSGLLGFQGGKAVAESDLFGKMIGAHSPGTTQTYTGSEADKLLHPDQEATGPGSVSESKTYAGPEGSKSYEEADKQLHPEKYKWYEKPWFGL